MSASQWTGVLFIVAAFALAVLVGWLEFGGAL